MSSDVTATCPLCLVTAEAHPPVRYFGLSVLDQLSPKPRKSSSPALPNGCPFRLYCLKIHQESEHTLDHILFCQTCDRHFSDHDDSKVTLICSGGSGNELGSTGFVGRGLLSASVYGDGCIR